MPPQVPPSASGESPESLRNILTNALRYWEWRRIPYNLVLAALVVGRLAFDWPKSRTAFDFDTLLAFTVLAVLANLCYCAAYFADIPLQYSALQAGWRKRRWALWLAGTLFAAALALYWLVDEIIPVLYAP